MPGTLSLVDLVTDLKASLQDAADVFTAADDADFKRHLKHAALDFVRVRPRTLLGELTLTADEALYALPADLHCFKSPLWGTRSARQWEKNYPGPLPRPLVIEVEGEQRLQLTPAPSAHQISVLGETYQYWYLAAHAIGDAAADTTIRAADRALLLLRAQAEAMKEMTIRNVKKPLAVRDGVVGVVRNGTPAALYQALMQDFERAGGLTPTARSG